MLLTLAGCSHAGGAHLTAVPALGLHDGQVITVQVTGFGAGTKVWLSECATAAAANLAGCGPQLAAQPFLVTDARGRAASSFTARSTAALRPYDQRATAPCTDACVLVATAGIGGRFARTPLAFRG